MIDIVVAGGSPAAISRFVSVLVDGGASEVSVAVVSAIAGADRDT